MATRFRCALAPFRIQGDAAPVHLFHVPLVIPSARLFGFVVGGEPAEAQRIVSVLQELAAQSAPKGEVQLEQFAAAFFKQANRAVRDLPLKSLAMKKSPVTSAVAAITYGQQIALSGRNALAFRTGGAGASAPSDLFGPEAVSDYRTLFPTLVFGGLAKRDTLLIASRTLLDYCAPAHLAKLMDAGTAEATREALLAQIQDLQPSSTIAGVAIKVVPAEQLLFQAESPTQSLNALLKQARETEALLTPAFLPSVGRLLNRVRSLFSRSPHQTAPRAARGTQLFRALPGLLRSLPERLATALVRVRDISLKQKMMLGLAALSTVIIFGVITAVWQNHLNSRDSRIAAELMAGITNQRAAVEASVLYGDETAAWTHLDAARAAAEQLPTRTRKGRQFKTEVVATLEADTRRLRREAVIDTPEIGGDESLFAVSLGETPLGAIYNSRLYRADPASAQVYKHNRAEGAWDAGAPWLVTGPDEFVRSASALAIDGSVFLGTSDGKLQKYHKGAAAVFTVGHVDPPIAAITRLRAPENSTFLYLLVPATRRVIVLDRNRGTLTAQYSSPAFDTLADLAVDEPNKKIYVKNGSSIFAIPAAHLQ